LLVALSCADPTGPAPRWAIDAFDPGVVWATDDTAGLVVVDGQRVYVATNDVPPRRLRALEKDNGAPVWTAPVLGAAQDMIVAGGRIALDAFEFYDPPTGSRVAASGGGTGLTSTDGTAVYAGTWSTGYAYAANATTGAILWNTKISGSATGTYGRGSAVIGNRVVVSMRYLRSSGTTSDTGIVAGLDRTTGAILWRRALDGPTSQNPFPFPHGPVLVSGDKVYVITDDHQIIAMSPETGAEIWRVDLNGSLNTWTISHGGAACDGKLYVPTGQLGLAALNAETGAIIWNVPVPIGSLYEVQCANGLVLARSGHVTVHDATTGALRRQFPRPRTGPFDPPTDDLFIHGMRSDASGIYLATTLGTARVQIQ
jgi:outer membrane protein assembly factor BamB